jgi:hypothetical protein
MEKLQKCVNFILTVLVFFLQPTVSRGGWRRNNDVTIAIFPF